VGKFARKHEVVNEKACINLHQSMTAAAEIAEIICAHRLCDNARELWKKVNGKPIDIASFMHAARARTIDRRF
jgi:hypothetical protein